MAQSATRLYTTHCSRSRTRTSLRESSRFWKATDVGEGALQDKVALWGALCNQNLRPERQELLAVVNRLSQQAAEDYAWVEWVASADMLGELRWSDGMDLLWPVAEELERLHFVRRHATMGPNVDLHATYRGLVWETRRGWTAEAQEIDRLVEEWETTSVEFKRNIQTNTAGEKAELMKDLLGLANTQASGRRWLILGFDGKTRRYVGSPNAKITQDHLEQLLGEYTRPYLHVAYGVVDYRGSSVGKIEVLRDRRALPYRVKKAVGDDQRGKRIEVDEVFVRRGSQTVRADVDEIAALEAEAAWATGRDRPE